jgi:eukaryotic-like serine/threonine-protein kinase
MILGGTYRITRLVAVGGMGELYEATHERLSGRYAVKVLLPQFAAYEEIISRFQREAEITSSLRHPNIVSVLDFNTTDDGRAFLAMEFLEGRDLGEDMTRQGPTSVARVVAINDQVVSALSAAHAHEVVHRDLKPQNLFISSLPGDGREMVKVLDFGISKMREAHTRLTRENSIMGTPQYMAPEQARGDSQAIDHRTDQFSLAAIVYEMLAGRPPFSGDSVSAVLYQVVHEPPPVLANFRRDVPPEVERVLMRAMAKEADSRFPSIGEFGQALLAAGGGQLARGATAHAMALAPTLVRTTASGHRARPVTARQRHMDTTFGASTAQVSNDELLMTMRHPRRQLGFTAAAIGGVALAAAAAWFSTRPVDQPAPRTATRAALPAPMGAAPAPSARAATSLNPGDRLGAPSMAGTGTPVRPAEPGLAPAPVRIMNPPAGLRVKVDGQPMEQPVHLPRKGGRYTLHFESPGRRPQTLEVDAMAPSHELRLTMPRLSSREDEQEIEAAISAADDPVPPTPPIPVAAPPPVPEPAAAPTAEKPYPSLIEDVDDTAPPAAPTPAEKPRVPLIEDP